ncbi:MAG TPA: AarF/ABC1/UbiB kinase family protein [Oscillatoriales cyanobacterium M59_W2019_021]|nr:AarF/ABC1/UbiB kinase family protein [Oscillatoriales cyanobacterium M4454_W2019_049]HIK51828.1 AarF/ABC1/UbiB kinase family protein [Oscillatoriales cyanobacterium M59_W2019_021]
MEVKPGATPTLEAGQTTNPPVSTTITVPGQPIPEAFEPSAIASDADSTALRYDPAAIAAYYRRRPAEVYGRFLGIVLPLAHFFLSLWWDRQRNRVKANEGRRAVQLRELLTRLGPAYIKIGQALSTRPDVVPPLYLEELGKLQDQLPPFPNEVAFRFIEEELGAPPQEIYAELSERPLAAASLGQVYKGKLKTGETVAVKVQRPDLREQVTLDMYLLRSIAIWAQQNIKRVRSDLVGIMDEFAERIFEEMDYNQEARNAELFAKLYGHLKDIYVPKIYREYTRRRVLTMEWIDGVKLTDLEKIRAQNIDASYLVEVGVQCSLRQLLEHGFFHADPHPGNLLATPAGKLAYLDFGMMSTIKPYQRYGLIEAVVHLVNRDFEGLAKDYVKLEFLTPETDLTPIVPALANVFSNALGASVAELNFKSITDQLSELMYEYPFRVPAYYALIIRSLVTLEGIAINVDPNFKVLSKAYPYVAKRLLTDKAPELRSSLRDLLFKDGDFRWNRLENLLKNARDNDDYNLSQALNQGLEFLFSERGTFIRDRMVDEIVKNIDLLSQEAAQNANSVLSEWFGLKVGFPNSQNNNSSSPKSSQDRKNLEHLKRIWGILQETPGFDAMELASLIPQLIVKPETQRMGQQIVGSLAQRTLARLIRRFLLTDSSDNLNPNISPMTDRDRPSLPAGYR